MKIFNNKKQKLADFIENENAKKDKQLQDKDLKEIKGGGADNRREFDHIGQFNFLTTTGK